jgi:hypothetical protein
MNGRQLLTSPPEQTSVGNVRKVALTFGISYRGRPHRIDRIKFADGCQKTSRTAISFMAEFMANLVNDGFSLLPSGFSVEALRPIQSPEAMMCHQFGRILN